MKSWQEKKRIIFKFHLKIWAIAKRLVEFLDKIRETQVFFIH